MSRYRTLTMTQIPLAILGAHLCYEMHKIRLALDKMAGIKDGNGIPIYMVLIFIIVAFIVGYSLKKEVNE